jgi:hypothetical protein
MSSLKLGLLTALNGTVRGARRCAVVGFAPAVRVVALRGSAPAGTSATVAMPCVPGRDGFGSLQIRIIRMDIRIRIRF